MDFKLADALMKFYPEGNTSDPAQRLFMLRDRQDKKFGMVARGRQILNHVWQEIVVHIQSCDAFTILTLAEVKLHGNALADFNNRWFSVLHEILHVVDEASLLHIYYKQVKNCPCLQDDMRFFNKLPKDHPLRTYRWL